MKKIIFLILAFALIALVSYAPVFKEARDHYQLYKYAKNTNRKPYTISIKPKTFFDAFVNRSGWKTAPTSTRQPYNTDNKVFDELGWKKDISSLIRFYSTDTRDISLFKWMLVPDSAKLPCIQEMSFREKGPREIFVDEELSIAIDMPSPNMAYLYIQTGVGIDCYIIVSDSAYQKIMDTRKRAEPNQALEPTNLLVTPCAPSSTSRAK